MPATTRYMTVYVEVFATGSDDEVRQAMPGALADAEVRTRDGALLGRVAHVEVTDGPKPVKQSQGSEDPAPLADPVIACIRSLDDVRAKRGDGEWPPYFSSHVWAEFLLALRARGFEVAPPTPLGHGALLRMKERVMNFGGFQRAPQGQFWVSRDDVVRLLDETGESPDAS